MNTFGIPELGRFFVLASVAFASMGAVTGLAAGARRSLQGWRWAKSLALGFAGSMIAANLLMIWALISHDFSVLYVAKVGSLSTPLYFTIVSLWASLDGSILFWGGILGVYVGAFALIEGDRRREYTPWALGVLLAVCVFFAMLVASVADPFARVTPIPPDGPGPNPLLQNHWLMAVHPPFLYLGFVGMVVPFAMGCASLLAGRLESGWLAPLRRWFLVPYAFLTVAIMLGGWWSYEVLGWGGYWAWDPVENASFMPWLTGTAFLHSVMVTQRRKRLKTWTLLLLFATFLLTLFGTFLTRSGVFNSVHSFTQSDIGPIFLGFIAVVFTATSVLVAVRESVLESEAPAGEDWLTRRVGKVHPLSRELYILAQNLTFTVFTMVVLLGTVFPLVMEAWDGTRLSVGQPFFDRFALPLGLMIVVLMGLGPALPWGRMKQSTATRRVLMPFIPAALLGAATLPFTEFSLITAQAITLCTWALWLNLAEYATPVRQRMTSQNEPVFTAATRAFLRARRRFGGHIAHTGIIVVVLGITASKGFQETSEVTLTPGQAVEVGGYEAVFTGAEEVMQDHRKSLVANVVVRHNGADLGVLQPALNYYPRQREPIPAPDVRAGFTHDYYLSLMAVAPDNSWVSLKVMRTPFVTWIWLGTLITAFGTLIALWPTRARARATAPSAQGAPA
ncbi:MAG: heme lyase CcmF/NrfE family subunit [Deltaproteobacteria bacterium]|nr:MAG: heme lyase CcmF/NrfE family subunit [Deltaproteobacteria bacterium]